MGREALLWWRADNKGSALVCGSECVGELAKRADECVRVSDVVCNMLHTLPNLNLVNLQQTHLLVLVVGIFEGRKLKIFPTQTTKVYRRGKVQLHSFLTSSLYGGE
jgi:hypothetical protein